jgi:hypothetical protein
MSNDRFVDDSHFTALLDVFIELCCLQEECPSTGCRPPPDFPNFSKRCIFASSHATMRMDPNFANHAGALVEGHEN